MTYSPVPPQPPPPISEPPPPVSQRPPPKRAKLLLAAAVALLTVLGIVGVVTNNHHSTHKPAAARPSSSPGPSSPTAPATTAPAPSPTPSVLYVDWTQAFSGPESVSDPITSFFAPLAKDKGVPGSAPYAGDAHPMAFLYRSKDTSDDWEFDIAKSYADSQLENSTIFSPPDSGNPLLFTDTSQVQLVVVVVEQSSASAGSCGSYKRQSDGKVGELLRGVDVITVTIRAAVTGRVIATRTFTSSPPSCPQSFTYTVGTDFSGDPPWTIPPEMLGGYDGTSTGATPAIRKWIDSFLTGPVRT